MPFPIQVALPAGSALRYPEGMTQHKLDPIDQEIVQRLSHDARISNRSIAKEVGITEGTVRQRIKRLQKDGLI